jgi:hypothetical protein
MHYDFIAIPDADVPQAVEPVFQHVLQTYAGETNRTASVVLFANPFMCPALQRLAQQLSTKTGAKFPSLRLCKSRCSSRPC